MGKKEISVLVLLCLLSFMLGAYEEAPYYGNQELCVGDGYVTLRYGEIYEKEVGDKTLFVYFSQDGWSGFENGSEIPRLLPLTKGKEVYYPLEETLETERISIGYQEDEYGFVLLQEYIVQKNSEQVKDEENDAFCRPESPCYEYGERTVALSEELWKKSGESEKAYVMQVFRFLSCMEYDYDATEKPKDKALEEYINRMDLEKVLEKNKGVCRDKANLMAVLLRLKNIPCKIVVGKYSKESDTGHAWNKVYIDEKWMLVDATISVMGGSEAGKKNDGLYIEEWSY